MLIANQFQNNTIASSLDFQGDPVGDSCGQALGQRLLVNQFLLGINLINTNVRNNGIRAIFQALQINRKLQVLGVYSADVTVDTMQIVLTALQQNSILAYLRFSYGYVGNDQNIIFLAEALQTNTGLKTLILTKTGITGFGAEKIALALKKNKALQALDISANPIGDIGALAFANMLLTNHVLTTLFLGYDYDPIAHSYSDGITDVGARALIESLKVNFVPTTLNLLSNPISNQTLITVNNLLARNAQCFSEAILCPVAFTKPFNLSHSNRVTLTDEIIVKTPAGSVLNNALINITDLFCGEFFVNNQVLLVFTQAQILAGLVTFMYSCLGIAFNITATIGNLSTYPQSAGFIMPTNASSTTGFPATITAANTGSAAPLALGSIIGIIAGALFTAMLIIMALFRWHNKPSQAQRILSSNNLSTFFFNNPVHHSATTTVATAFSETDMGHVYEVGESDDATTHSTQGNKRASYFDVAGYAMPVALDQPEPGSYAGFKQRQSQQYRDLFFSSTAASHEYAEPTILSSGPRHSYEYADPLPGDQAISVSRFLAAQIA